MDEFAKLKVLVVEDNEITQLIVQKSLHLAGVGRVDIAIDGLDAVQKVNQTDYDIVFMDVMMPKMNGHEATEIIRKVKGASLPIIALTALNSEEDRKQCVASGMTSFIAKPFEIDDLVDSIRQHAIPHYNEKISSQNA